MAAFGRTEAYVQGWDIAPEQLQICRSSLDGSEVLLGSGQFGKVLFKCERCCVFALMLTTLLLSYCMLSQVT